MQSLLTVTAYDWKMLVVGHSGKWFARQRDLPAPSRIAFHVRPYERDHLHPHNAKIYSCYVKPSVPALTPFVRSDASGAILAELFVHSENELSLAELGRRTGVSAAVVHKEVGRLVESGIAVDRVEGRNRLIRVNPDHPLFAPMQEIVLATYGPVPVLRELLAEVAGVQQSFIYGSWAARQAGELGPPPGDIDVLILGDTPRRKLSKIASEGSDRLGVPVNITRLSAREWGSSDPTPFVKTVRSRALFPLTLGGDSA